MSDETRTNSSQLSPEFAATAGRLGLMIVWSLTEPARVGETALLPASGGLAVLGRGPDADNDPGVRLAFEQLRPWGGVPGGPLRGHGVSRRQLLVRAVDGKVELERLGRAKLVVDGKAVDQAELSPGSTCALEGQLVLRVTMRNEPSGGSPPSFAFGAADPFGVIGESPATWALRKELSFLARLGGHVLVSGAGGSGRQLAARALHLLSPRRTGPFVATRAAGLQPAVIAGLLADAEGGTLFFDELADLPESLRPHIVRLLDAADYQRLGDDPARRADLRLIGATSRSEAALDPELSARFRLKLAIPGLDLRRDDVPLLVRGLLRRRLDADPALRARFVDEQDETRIAPDLILALLEHSYWAHVRELEGLVGLALSESSGDYVALTPSVAERTGFAPSAWIATPNPPPSSPSAAASAPPSSRPAQPSIPPSSRGAARPSVPPKSRPPKPNARPPAPSARPPAPSARPPAPSARPSVRPSAPPSVRPSAPPSVPPSSGRTSSLPSRERVEAVLESTRGDVSRAWKELGLSSRDTLHRLLKKYGIAAGRRI